MSCIAVNVLDLNIIIIINRNNRIHRSLLLSSSTSASQVNSNVVLGSSVPSGSCSALYLVPLSDTTLYNILISLEDAPCLECSDMEID